MTQIQELENTIDVLNAKMKLYRFCSLTGMKQRTDFKNDMEIKFNSRNKFYMAMYDIDGLHKINRDYGYDKGDALIVNVANSIRLVPGAACSYRLNGDEMFVIHPKKPTEEQLRVNNATHAFVYSKDYKTFDEMFNAVDAELTKRKKILGRRREDM